MRTPKTMYRAIYNGLERASTVGMMPVEAEGLADEIEPHVKDFLAQKFNVAMLDDDTGKVTALWNAIFPEDQK